jgi:hypothetical protein
MRYVDNVTPRDLGLTADEIAFLLPAAEAGFQAFATKTGYDRSNEAKKRNAYSDHINRLKPPRADEQDIICATTLRDLLTHRGENSLDGALLTPTRLDDSGLGLEHSSYGAVAVSNPSGANAYLVGANSISQYSKSITFNFAEVYVDRGREDRPGLHAGVGRKLELALSAEQFIMMVRGDAGFYTPCGVQINDGHWNDRPPATTFDAHESINFESILNDLLKEVSAEIALLKELVSKGASKKTEYAAFVEQTNRISEAYTKVIDEVLALGNAKGAAEGQRAQRQFINEMNERLGQLKVEQTVQELLGLGKD